LVKSTPTSNSNILIIYHVIIVVFKVNKASTRKDKFTQVNFPRRQRSSRKSRRPNFRPENAVDASIGVPLPAARMTSSPGNAEAVRFGFTPSPPLPATSMTSSPGNAEAVRFDFTTSSPPPREYVPWQPQSPFLGTVVAAGFGCPPPPPPKRYVGSAWYESNFQPQLPRYVGPAWYEANFRPQLPRYVAPSRFCYPSPSLLYRSGFGAVPRM